MARNKKIRISEQDFKRYVRVQMSGVTNMFAIDTVRRLTGLTEQKIKSIMDNYDSLCDAYPSVG
jgi:hypothetical protein